MGQKSLRQIVAEQPFREYTDWWDVGQLFLSFMSGAIVSQWAQLQPNGEEAAVNNYVSDYLDIVYDKKARVSLVTDFVDQSFSEPIRSGEFDALSYAFFRSAFELIERHIDECKNSLEVERRLFTKRVGKIFFSRLRNHLNLDLPGGLADEQSFACLKDCIHQIGAFLHSQGYLRDHFGFLFTLDGLHAGRRIVQAESQFLQNLELNGMAYALYEMGYAVILPSAVYLYHTIGEAQHHSSRTIEELFELVGYEARETDDFDPIEHPADMVVELWEIRKLA